MFSRHGSSSDRPAVPHGLESSLIIAFTNLSSIALQMRVEWCQSLCDGET
ncbi:hypothetical protein TC41_2642 [Alicyclobacillus acidocaldarius subsp. acidocaldarius Tc-4-1]|uniref:Uncharacterized protein n=1 Tax=Alicyclobacillus acidocaldarius (strain Tc-4-1) TaxID=1048834 RepID=F8II57_ALIAT|nr:hypothetical protein TC41_2642 [Alicyclobacillus acidocaldarius subsp. acidocaldarius Tc-4-1]